MADTPPRLPNGRTFDDVLEAKAQSNKVYPYHQFRARQNTKSPPTPQDDKTQQRRSHHGSNNSSKPKHSAQQSPEHPQKGQHQEAEDRLDVQDRRPDSPEDPRNTKAKLVDLAIFALAYALFLAASVENIRSLMF